MKDHHFFAGSEDDTVETERPFHSENERNLSNCPLRKMLREFPGRRSSSLTDLRKIEINRNLNLNVSKSQESISISKSDISYDDSHLPDVWENYERRKMTWHYAVTEEAVSERDHGLLAEITRDVDELLSLFECVDLSAAAQV
ncbi:unnamed protein product [Porites evermanni]|uniref:Uncharacterized protein n=1 Tax=Porites evermanni TaxID=104178 RepID=A0ABN8QB31_9CNID|nr:unnamed protein product [Porites evermanni]